MQLALWATMRLYNINGSLIRAIECFYNKATSAVYHDNNIGEWLRTTIGVRQGCLPTLTLLNIFLERIMAGALEDHEGTVSMGGRAITNLRFADDIDCLAGQERELVKLVNHIEEASTTYGMQISAEKTQLMTNNTNGISTDIFVCMWNVAHNRRHRKKDTSIGDKIFPQTPLVSRTDIT